MTVAGDLTLLVAFGAGVVHTRDEPHAPDSDLVPRAERELPPDPLAVHEGPVTRGQIADAPARGNPLEEAMHARDRPVERQGDVVRRYLTDRDPLALELDPIARVSDPHLVVVVPLGPLGMAVRIGSGHVTHDDGTLSPQDGSVPSPGWNHDRLLRMIAL